MIKQGIQAFSISINGFQEYIELQNKYAYPAYFSIFTQGVRLTW